MAESLAFVRTYFGAMVFSIVYNTGSVSYTHLDVARITSVSPIRAVLCNGGTAGRLYHRWLEPQSGLAAQILPSTSPANAAWGEERLVAAWSEVLLPLLP